MHSEHTGYPGDRGKPVDLPRQRTFQEHLEIVNAVEKRDAAALREIPTAHIAEMEPNYANAPQLV